MDMEILAIKWLAAGEAMTGAAHLALAEELQRSHHTKVVRQAKKQN